MERAEKSPGSTNEVSGQSGEGPSVGGVCDGRAFRLRNLLGAIRCDATRGRSLSKCGIRGRSY